MVDGYTFVTATSRADAIRRADVEQYLNWDPQTANAVGIARRVVGLRETLENLDVAIDKCEAGDIVDRFHEASLLRQIVRADLKSSAAREIDANTKRRIQAEMADVFEHLGHVGTRTRNQCSCMRK
jgi:hypothetical protein